MVGYMHVVLLVDGFREERNGKLEGLIWVCEEERVGMVFIHMFWSGWNKTKVAIFLFYISHEKTPKLIHLY
ncbi:hypothetical protein Hanom_Chr13g01236921 [Helianthus anomalus]